MFRMTTVSDFKFQNRVKSSKLEVRIFNSSFGNGQTIHYLYMTNNEPEPKLQMTNKSKHKHLEKMLEVYKCGIEHATRKKRTNVWWCRRYERACALRTVSGVVQEVETG
jgi:hypothetical protein